MPTWYLVAGGPSLRGFDFSRLKGKYVCAVNRSYQSVPDAQIVFWSDWRFYTWNRDQIAAHRAMRKITALRRYPNGKYDRDHAYDLKRDPIEIWTFTGKEGLDRSPCCLRHGNNSGYAAINVVTHFYATKIVLMGYDLQAAPDGATHHHPDHPVKTDPRHYRGWVDNYRTLVEPLRKMGIEVINTSMDSLIDCFPKRHIDSVL